MYAVLLRSRQNFRTLKTHGSSVIAGLCSRTGASLQAGAGGNREQLQRGSVSNNFSSRPPCRGKSAFGQFPTEAADPTRTCVEMDVRMMDRVARYRLLCAAIVPRPIAVVSTCSTNQVHNLAAFSFFMPVTSEPPTLALSITRWVLASESSGRRANKHWAKLGPCGQPGHRHPSPNLNLSLCSLVSACSLPNEYVQSSNDRQMNIVFACDRPCGCAWRLPTSTRNDIGVFLRPHRKGSVSRMIVNQKGRGMPPFKVRFILSQRVPVAIISRLNNIEQVWLFHSWTNRFLFECPLRRRPLDVENGTNSSFAAYVGQGVLPLLLCKPQPGWTRKRSKNRKNRCPNTVLRKRKSCSYSVNENKGWRGQWSETTSTKLHTLVHSWDGR